MRGKTRKGVALITGGGTGVGAATAGMLAERDFAVAVNYSRSADAAEATAEECRRLGADAMAMRGDVSSDADCRSMIAAVIEKFGALDLLVNSAGATQITKFSDLDVQNGEDLLRIYSVNVVGAYQMGRAAAPHLKQSGRGAIVNVSSIAGQTGSGSSIAYVLSKGALNTLTLTFARLLAPEVRVNAVLPGLIDTAWFTGNGVEEGAFETMKRRFEDASALGSVATAKDIAQAIVYAGVDAVRMTGQFLTIDAGFLLGKPPQPSR
ncbi:MAG: SDR family NAD(P)-dependent oxidoreductase [Rhizobiaceae bacterium]|jgi:3-oxoacyl-[acyl-carrier protein] reductase